MKRFLPFILLLVLAPFAAEAKQKILIVVAHPDDEYYFAGATYRAAIEKQAQIDELIITNGEGGFRYAELSDPIYRAKLDDENIAREKLPAIREAESIAGGKLIGIQKHTFLREKDFGFTDDPAVAFKTWDKKKILAEITQVLLSGQYQFVWVLMPIPSTHGHHQAASLLALEAVKAMNANDRPVVLAGITDQSQDQFQDADHEREVKQGRAFQSLKAYPDSQIQTDSEGFWFNRVRKFGYHQKLTYQIPINWMIAEHKSQGVFQTFMNRDDREHYRVFALSGDAGVKRAKEFFDWLNSP